MADNRIEVETKFGERGTVPESGVKEFLGSGGRVLSDKELVSERLDKEYGDKPVYQKALGVVAPALPYPAQVALRASGAAPLPPTLEAYRSGASQGFTGGLDELATKGLARAALGAEASQAYGKHIEDVRQNSPLSHGAGELVGLTAGLVAASTPSGGALPVGLTARLGAAAEARAAGLLAKAAGGGVAKIGGMAARGAVEGAVLSASKQATEDILGDHETSAERLFIASGLGALGGAGAGAAFGAAGGMLGKLGRSIRGGATSAAREAAEAEASSLGGRAAEREGASALVKAAESAKGAEAAVDSLRREVAESAAARATTDRGAAYGQFWKALGATSSANKEAISKFGPDGNKIVGEVLHRRGVFDTEGGAMSSAWKNLTSGHPTDILPRVTAAKEAATQELTGILGAENGRIKLTDVVKRAADMHGEMMKDPARIAAGGNLVQESRNLFDAMHNAGLVAEDGTVSIRDLYANRAMLEGKVHTYGSDTLSKQAVKEWLREVDKMTLANIDPKGAKAIVELKHDLKALHVAEDAAEASQTRYLTNRNMSLTSYGVGASIGGPKGILAAMAHQYVKDRGNAAAGAALLHLADLGYLSRVNRLVDDMVSKAAAGAIHGPGLHARTSRPMADVPLRKRALDAMNHARDMKANPEVTGASIEETYAPVVRVAPNVGAYAIRRTLDAVNMLASKAPATQRDPLNPYGPPRMNDLDAAAFARTYEYAMKPHLFLEDAAAGRVSREGAMVMRSVAPKVYRDFQERVMAGLQTQVASGKPVGFNQRMKLALVVDFPTDPALDPKVFAGLQENVSSPPGGKPKGGGGGGGKVKIPGAEPSTFDRIEKE